EAGASGRCVEADHAGGAGEREVAADDVDAAAAQGCRVCVARAADGDAVERDQAGRLIDAAAGRAGLGRGVADDRAAVHGETAAEDGDARAVRVRGAEGVVGEREQVVRVEDPGEAGEQGETAARRGGAVEADRAGGGEADR